MTRFLLLALSLPVAALSLGGCDNSNAVGAPRPVPLSALAPTAQPVAQGATFVVRVGEGEGAERFVVRISDPAAIETARRSMRGELDPRPVLTGEIREGNGGFNRDPGKGRPWSWHLDPATVAFADVTIELCDGRPSDIESDKSYWIGNVRRFCPWGNRIERELPVLKTK